MSRGDRSFRAIRRQLLLAMLVVFAVLTGCRRLSPREWGAPARPIRVATYNIENDRGEREQVRSDLNSIDADIVMLQEVQASHVDELIRSLGFEHCHYEPDLFPPNDNVDADSSSRGIMILSRFPLSDVESIPGGGMRGIWGIVVVDGKQFVVASVHLSATWKLDAEHIRDSFASRAKETSSYVQAWGDRGRPPIILAGDCNNPPMGPAYDNLNAAWTDTLAWLDHKQPTLFGGPFAIRSDYIWISDDWSAIDGGVVESNASDHRPVWAVVRGK